MKRFLPPLLSGLLALALPFAARAAGPPARLDPALAPALVSGGASVGVWVEFTDKGEQGPADLAARLSQAERELTAESRARRVRTGVTPLVDYRDLPVSPEYLRTLEQRGLQPYGVSRWFNGVAVRASGEALARLASLDCVLRVSAAPVGARRAREPLPAVEPAVIAVPPGAARASGVFIDYGMTATQLARLNVPALHDSGYIGTGVLVCMFDNGFNYYDKHTATRNIDVGSRTRDFVRGGTSVQDTSASRPGGIYMMHGQWTLSTIGGNAPGIYMGPAFGARYALAHTEDDASEKPVEMVNWLMAAEWADSIGADIISSSLGYLAFPDSAGTSLTYAQLDGHTAIVTRATEIAAAKGILVVNSAGNDGAYSAPNTLNAPADACGDSMLAVGSVDSTGVRAGSSSYGPSADGRTKPDVMAQGVQVLMASASGAPDTYIRNNGTSFSCPLTAGVAACLIQARPSWSLTQLVHAMKFGASQAGNPDNYYGWGMVNGLAALRIDTAGVPPGRTPLRFKLDGANPARLGGAPVSFSLALASGARAAEYAVRVYDVTGRLVRTLWSGYLTPLGAGPGRIAWDGTDSSGRLSRPGLYLVSFEGGHQRTTIRIVAVP